MQQLESLLEIAKGTGKLKRIFLWDSFASLKLIPNDLDVLLVFSADFADEDLSDEVISILDHEQAKVRYQADVFWIRENIVPEVFICFWILIRKTASIDGAALWRFRYDTYRCPTFRGATFD
jgi:hypothetical protein